MINNRLTKLFAEKKSEILSIFYTAGYPELNDTVNIAQACQSAGVDLLEIGIPFSDSLVDGPTIQASNEVALSNGMSLNALFEQLKELRASVNLPIILMGCINPIEQYGMQKFCQKLNELGIDGALIADLPPEVFESDYRSILKNII
jgi:tryptophan synthase alpha chain